MTKRVGKVAFIEPEPPDVCTGCGKKAELRPYGPGGKRVCFDCGMKDEPAAKRAFRSKVLGEESN